MVSLILMVFAFVLFVLSAFYNYWRPNPAPVGIGWLGLAFWVFADLLSRAGPGLGIH